VQAGRRGRARSVRPGALARSVAGFLDALDLPPPVRGGADLEKTPERVAEAWAQDLLDGYRHDPAEILREAMPSAGGALVAVTGIDFHSVCPHHLLPSRGLAHVAYVPGDRVVGFGQLARLVDALAHRLVLQEDLARQIAQALMEHLGARGAACVLEAEHLCLSVRGERRAGARVHAEAYAGALAREGAARRRFLGAVSRASVGASATGPGSSRARARARSRGGR
jgi:GTP cyclohydrolase I